MNITTFRRRFQPGITTFNASHTAFSAAIVLLAGAPAVALTDKITGIEVGTVALDPMNEPTTATRFVITSKKVGLSFVSIPAALRAIVGSLPSDENRRRGIGRMPVAAKPVRRLAAPFVAKLLIGVATMPMVFAC